MHRRHAERERACSTYTETCLLFRSLGLEPSLHAGWDFLRFTVFDLKQNCPLVTPFIFAHSAARLTARRRGSVAFSGQRFHVLMKILRRFRTLATAGLRSIFDAKHLRPRRSVFHRLIGSYFRASSNAEPLINSSNSFQFQAGDGNP